MAKVLINNILSNVNPTNIELGTYQKHGLSPNDRKPNDYLRMVARTFSSFRNTHTNETVVSYVNGFDITVNETEVPDKFPTEPNKVYNIFKIKSGTCVIDNQLIDIFEDTYYIFENTNFIPSTKYGIVIEYDYIEQRQDNIAKIRFITYDSLHFPRIEDKNTVICDFKDTSLNGDSSNIEFSGKPGLLIATFSTSSDNDNDGKSRQIIQSNPTIPGSLVPGIDPQYLSKLYIQNYKLLFKYFGNQSKAIYSSMGMTSANFISVAEDQIYKSDDPNLASEEDLRSGDMCYYDEESGKYKRSVNSRQHFSQVIGLYLNEYNEGIHLIYTNGYITCDAVKHNLPVDHQLLTMTPGAHYFLEDAASLFDTQHQIRTIDNYVLADSSGRISNRYYPSAVMVGTATACNQIVLNIDHSSEIDTQNLLSLFGSYDEYKKEYDANNDITKAQQGNKSLTSQNLQLQTSINNSKTYLGTDDALSVNAFCTNYSSNNISYAFTYLLYNILKEFFTDGFNAKKIYDIDINSLWSTFDFGNLNDTQQLDIHTKILEYKNLKNLKNLLNESISDINILLLAKQNELISFATTFDTETKTRYKSEFDLKLKIARYALGDDPASLDKFENYQLLSNQLNIYTGPGSLTEDAQSSINTINNTQASNFQDYPDKITEINVLKSMAQEQTIYQEALTELINEEIKINVENALKISDNNIKIIENTKHINASTQNIMNSDVEKLDIFQMSDYQRTIFNYTYITDRLQKRLILVDKLSTDLVKAQTLYEAIYNNPQSTLIEQVSSLGEVNRIKNYIQSNTNFIKNYTEEYNKIRFELGKPAITEGDINFDDLGLANQKIGTYRYGCDDFETTYGGLATNLITKPCGPYTMPDGFIISKNSQPRFIDVLSNDGHSQGNKIYMNSVNSASHGTSKVVTRFLFVADVLDDTDYSNYTLTDDNSNNILFIVEENTIYSLIDGVVDLTGYVLHNSQNNIPKGKISITTGVSYMPEHNYTGNDIFKYSIKDDDDKIAVGTITVSVTGPYAVDDHINIIKNSDTSILDVLSNDGHTGGERIIIMSATNPSHGTISVIHGTADNVGEITYKPLSNYIGTDNFEYSITDGNISTDNNGNLVSDGAVVTGRVYLTIK